MDESTPFKNSRIDHLRETKSCAHHFTLLYCPLANGTMDLVARKWAVLAGRVYWYMPLVCLVRIDCTKYLIGIEQHQAQVTWPSPSDHRLEIIMVYRKGTVLCVRVSNVHKWPKENSTALMEAFKEIHKKVFLVVEKAREQWKSAYKSNQSVNRCKLNAGHFVLRGVVREIRAADGYQTEIVRTEWCLLDPGVHLS